MAYRTMSNLFGIASLGAVLAAGYLYLRPPAEGPALVVQEPDRVLHDALPGEVYEVEFRVQNRTGRTLRVVGAPSC